MFQFQYGTIKSSLRVRGYHKIIKFQFQYGTIKRNTPKKSLADVPRFQFQYGTIKRENPDLSDYTKECFNSNMVRLKVNCRLLKRRWKNVFQFQYGTIKRGVFLLTLFLVNVSIPIWYD